MTCGYYLQIELEFHKRTKDKEMANVMHLDIMSKWF